MKKSESLKQFQMEQEVSYVEATMAIENMPLTPNARQNIMDISTGKKTTEQVIAELDKKYMHNLGKGIYG